MSAPNPGRDDELAQIRATYEEYRASGRDRLWQADNPGYARMSSERTRALVSLVRQSLPPAGSILDLGCGSGDLFADVRAAGIDADWWGMDLLSASLETAIGRYPQAHWIEGSADEVPMADGSVDMVIASTLFSSLPSPAFEERVAHEVRRVLPCGGWLVWYDLRYPSPGNPSVHPVSRRRLQELFPGWDHDLRTLTLLPPIARRLGRATGVLYPTFGSIPAFRSHLVGRLRQPVVPR